jgi:hypothetical protein
MDHGVKMEEAPIEKEKSYQEKRLNICLSCELVWKHIPYMEQCSNCLCFIRAKTLLKSQSCPIGKW